MAGKKGEVNVAFVGGSADPEKSDEMVQQDKSQLKNEPSKPKVNFAEAFPLKFSSPLVEPELQDSANTADGAGASASNDNGTPDPEQKESNVSNAESELGLETFEPRVTFAATRLEIETPSPSPTAELEVNGEVGANSAPKELSATATVEPRQHVWTNMGCSLRRWSRRMALVLLGLIFVLVAIVIVGSWLGRGTQPTTSLDSDLDLCKNDTLHLNMHDGNDTAQASDLEVDQDMEAANGTQLATSLETYAETKMSAPTTGTGINGTENPLGK